MDVKSHYGILNNDKKFIKDDTLLIDLVNKEIASKKNNEIELLSALPRLALVDNSNGVIRFKLNDSRTFKIIFGKIIAPSNATTNLKFHTTFEERCYSLQVTQVNNDTVSGIMAEIVDESSFDLTLSGGKDNETIMYLAFGI